MRPARRYDLLQLGAPSSRSRQGPFATLLLKRRSRDLAPALPAEQAVLKIPITLQRQRPRPQPALSHTLDELDAWGVADLGSEILEE